MRRCLMFRKFNTICKRLVIFVVAALTVGASVACAGNVGVDLNIHLGNPQPQPVVVPVPPPPPVPALVIEEDVNFVYPETLGFYVAVGVPYDLFFVRNQYYLFRDGRWFMAPRSRGPWMVARHRDLPPGLRRHRIEQIRTIRNSEYDIYSRDREHYRGKHLHTAKEEWKEERREQRERWKEEKREEKEERGHGRGGRHGRD